VGAHNASLPYLKGLGLEKNIVCGAERVTLVKYLSGGKFGLVYTAASERLGEVAVKLVKPQSTNEAFSLTNECLRMNMLQDDPDLNVPRCFAHCTLTGTRPTPAMVMTLVPHAQTLEQFQDNHNGSLGIVAVDIYKALIAMRRKKVVHTDIKNDNILVSSNGGNVSTWIIDFGLAWTETQMNDLCNDGEQRKRNRPWYQSLPRITENVLAKFCDEFHADKWSTMLQRVVVALLRHPQGSESEGMVAFIEEFRAHHCNHGFFADRMYRLSKEQVLEHAEPGPGGGAWRIRGLARAELFGVTCKDEGAMAPPLNASLDKPFCDGEYYFLLKNVDLMCDALRFFHLVNASSCEECQV